MQVVFGLAKVERSVTASRVTICDVSPRDGLQNEATTLDASIRAELCTRLASAGIPAVEAVSFVSPKAVPQMAGAEEVLRALDAAGPWSALVLNSRGLDRAIAAGLGEIHIAIPVTDTYCLRNQGVTAREMLGIALDLEARARAAGMKVEVILSAAFGCPFEGRVDPGWVAALGEQLGDAEPDRVVLADSIGVALPGEVKNLVQRLVGIAPEVGIHLHDTQHAGYANALAAADAGCTYFESSTAGLGGCPFAPGATGNIATEQLVALLDREGLHHGVDLDRLRDTSRWVRSELGRAAERGVPA